MGWLDRLGSFGERVWDRFKDLIAPITQALKFGRDVGIEITPAAAYRELSHVYRKDDYAPVIAALAPDQYVPDAYYSTAEIPWNRPYAYEVEFYGRDLTTGRFAHTSRILTFSRPMTIGEIGDEAAARFGSEGAYPQLDIIQSSVTGAETRPGENR